METETVLESLRAITYPDVNQKSNLDKIRTVFESVNRLLTQIAQANLKGNQIEPLIHTPLQPPRWERYTRSAPDYRQEYLQWRIDATSHLYGKIWSHFPETYQQHLKGCKTCKNARKDIDVVINLHKWVKPKPKKAVWFERAIVYLETRYNLDQMGNNPWPCFEQAACSLVPIEGFGEAYLQHVRGCTKSKNNSKQKSLCASWAVFDAVVSDLDHPLSADGIRDALHGLTRPNSKTILFRGAKAVLKDIQVYQGCSMLTRHIAKVEDKVEQQELILMMLNASAGVDKGRGGLRKETWTPKESGLVHLPTNPRDLDLKSFQLKDCKEEIVKHVERRVRLFLELCMVIWKDKCEYSVRTPLCTYGSETVQPGHQRCHSAIVPLVDRIKGRRKELGSGGLFYGTHFLDRLNHTVNLPIECNRVDRHLEDALRTKVLEPLLNEVSGLKGGPIHPLEATTQFIDQLFRKLLELSKRYQTNNEWKKFEYAQRHMHALLEIKPENGEVSKAFLDYCIKKVTGGSWDDELKTYSQRLRSTKSPLCKTKSLSTAAKHKKKRAIPKVQKK